MKSHNCWFRSRRSQLSLVEPAAQTQLRRAHVRVCVLCAWWVSLRWVWSRVLRVDGWDGGFPQRVRLWWRLYFAYSCLQSKWIKSNIRLQAVKLSCACLHFLSFTYVPLPECHSTRKIIPHVTPCAQLISILIPPHAIFIFIDNFVTITAKT